LVQHESRQSETRDFLQKPIKRSDSLSRKQLEKELFLRTFEIINNEIHSSLMSSWQRGSLLKNRGSLLSWDSWVLLKLWICQVIVNQEARRSNLHRWQNLDFWNWNWWNWRLSQNFTLRIDSRTLIDWKHLQFINRWSDVRSREYVRP